jgi:transcriptional regulator with XRE-family HTH domain
MKSRLFERLPPQVVRSLNKLGRDIGIARRKRRITAKMMAERMGVSRPTYLRAERGDATVGMGVYAMALFVLGLGSPLGDLVDASRDDQALVLDIERLPQRVRPKTQPTEL